MKGEGEGVRGKRGRGSGEAGRRTGEKGKREAEELEGKNVLLLLLARISSCLRK